MFRKSFENYEQRIADSLSGLYDAVVLKSAKLGGRVDQLEQAAGMRAANAGPTLAEKLIGDADAKAFLVDGKGDRCRVALSPTDIKAAIIGSGAINDPLVPSHKPDVDPGIRRRLMLRDTLLELPTENGAIEMPVKTGYTEGSPQAQNREGTPLGEAGYEFVNSFVPVETIGFTLPASKQIMEDSGQLNAFLSTELMWGLAMMVENQILNGSLSGTGTGSELTGLLANAVNYAPQSPPLTNPADILRDAMRQVQVADFNPTHIVLHPNDWYDLETAKTGDDANKSGAPRLVGAPRLYGVTVLVTNTIGSGTFLVADMDRAGVLFNRQEAAIEIARHDGTNFQENMLTFRALERLALVVSNPMAMVTGTFS